MRKISRSAYVPYTAEEMFVLVDDVAAYPEFLEWCKRAEVHRRTDDAVEATLELHKGKISKTFTTRNTRQEFEKIDLALIDGPFRHLSGGWQFSNLGNEGCKVSIDLEFEFDNSLVDVLFGAFFEETCNSMVDAFSRRAVSIYGNR